MSLLDCRKLGTTLLFFSLLTLMLLLRAILGGTFSLALVWSGVGVDLAVAVVSIFVY